MRKHYYPSNTEHMNKAAVYANFTVLAHGKVQFGPDTLDNVVAFIRGAEATLHLTEGFDAPSPYTIGRIDED